MTNELEIAIDKLGKILRKECGLSNIVAVNICYSAEGCLVEFEKPNPDPMRRANKSMKNICGEWI